MALFPVSLSLTDRNCLVVGSNTTGLAIASELRDQGAIVTVIGDPANNALPDGCINYRRNFISADLDGCWLAVAGSVNKSENESLKKHCEQRRVFCYDPFDQNAATWQPRPISIETDQIDNPNRRRTGLVSLVGAGPGHPDLLTVRALKLIQTADVIVYDRLVSDPVLALCNKAAKFVYAGKAKANHSLPQQSINALLVELAGQYKNVVRLKGGDPFIFGRGGEEIETLAEHDIQFQIIPGITAASGCAAFAGIPLTHRDHAQSCIFVTGHLRNGEINLNWNELKDPHQTIVVYMGLTGVKLICKSLIEHGRSADTPAALIERGTKPEQRVLVGTLSRLPDLVAKNDVVAPTMLFIGGVVSLRDKLWWF